MAAAPCIPLEDGVDLNHEHGRVSSMQKADAKTDRDNFKKKKSPTYAEARTHAKVQLTTPAPGPGLSPGEADCVFATRGLTRSSRICAPRG